MTRDKLFLVIGALMGSIVGTGIYLFIWENFYKPGGFTDYGFELLPFFIIKILFVGQNIGGTFTLLLSPEDSSDKAVFAHYLFGALMGIPLGIYGFDHFF